MCINSLEELNSYYREISILCYNEKCICLKGQKDSGKTYILNKIFNESKSPIRIMQTGCSSEYQRMMLDNLYFEYKNNIMTQNLPKIFLFDELDDEESVHKILEFFSNNLHNIIVCTNYYSETIFKDFYVYDIVDKFPYNAVLNSIKEHCKSDIEFDNLGIGDALNLLKILKDKPKHELEYADFMTYLNSVKKEGFIRKKDKCSINHSMTIISSEKFNIIRMLDYRQKM